MTDDEARRHVERTEARLGAVESLDSTARTTATEAVETLVDLYGAVLERVVDVVGSGPPDLLRRLTSDELVGHVLMAHGIVPAPPDLFVPVTTEAAPVSEVPVAFVGRKPSPVGGG